MSNLDTTSKRRSSCQVLQPWQLTPPEPTGGIEVYDRQHIANAYSGILPQDISGMLVQNIILQDFVFVAGGDFARALVHNIILQDFATGEVQANSLVDTLTLFDSATFIVDGVQATDNTLVFDEDVESRLPNVDLGLAHRLDIDEEITGFISTQSFTLAQTLNLADEVRVVLPQQNLSHTLTFTETVQSSLGFSHTLALTDSVVDSQSKALSTTLELVDSVTITHEQHLSVSTTLALRDSAFGYADRQVDLCHYNPASTVLSPTAPTYSKQEIITLTYPYVSPTVTLTLRAPQFENVERDSYNRIIRESRGGAQKIFRDPIWPKNKRLSYEIAFNKNQKVQDFIDFANQCLGKEIGLVDYLNRQWKGLLIPPENVFTHVSRGNRQLSFDFEGELV